MDFTKKPEAKLFMNFMEVCYEIIVWIVVCHILWMQSKMEKAFHVADVVE